VSRDADAERADAASNGEILDELFAAIEDRKERLPEDSYTASLFRHEKGENAVLEKLGEESSELLLAAKDDDREEIAHESADIVYHLLVLLSMKDMDVADLRAELRERR
jgi:phosphoribosyl-ATP pyrophosphohydrolase